MTIQLSTGNIGNIGHSWYLSPRPCVYVHVDFIYGGIFGTNCWLTKYAGKQSGLNFSHTANMALNNYLTWYWCPRYSFPLKYLVLQRALAYSAEKGKHGFVDGKEEGCWAIFSFLGFCAENPQGLTDLGFLGGCVACKVLCSICIFCNHPECRGMQIAVMCIYEQSCSVLHCAVCSYCNV